MDYLKKKKKNNPEEKKRRMQRQHNQQPLQNQIGGGVRENFNGCSGNINCLAAPQNAMAKDMGGVSSPCMKCTSIYMALKDRSPYDRMYLRTYNRLPSNYVTNLDSLVFAP